MTGIVDGAPGAGEDPRYVLVTECLQNDFFLHGECRLVLPPHVVRTVLLGKRGLELDLGTGSRRRLPAGALAEGPLGRFFEATIGRRRREQDGRGILHVINIRDWHGADATYDAERRAYGSHCERNTWGARYVDGLDRYLDPAGGAGTEACYFEEGRVRIYHLHADSMFDFKPRFAVASGQRKFRGAEIEDLLDVIVQGTDDDLARMAELLRAEPNLAAIHDFAREVDERDVADAVPDACVYVAVLGVYTDLKVKTLLTSLRTRYDLRNLAVSDTFSASATLERHLGGLDFAAKVLNVEVVHGINNLVRFVGGSGDLEDEADLVAADSYSRYQSFFQDQQNVLSYQNERLQDYLLLTERRALQLYETIMRSNRFLIGWGMAFLVATLALSIASAVAPGRVDWKLAAITGGLSLVQFVGAFFSQPMADMQRNLTNLAVFKMILESHSLKTAFARFHLTTPQTLRELQTTEEAEASARQIGALQQQLAVIDEFDRADFDGLGRLGFHETPTAANGDGAKLAGHSQ